MNQASSESLLCAHTLSVMLLDIVLSMLSILSICYLYVNYLIHSSQTCEVGGADIIIPISQRRKRRHHKYLVTPEKNLSYPILCVEWSLPQDLFLCRKQINQPTNKKHPKSVTSIFSLKNNISELNNFLNKIQILKKTIRDLTHIFLWENAHKGKDGKPVVQPHHSQPC